MYSEYLTTNEVIELLGENRGQVCRALRRLGGCFFSGTKFLIPRVKLVELQERIVDLNIAERRHSWPRYGGEL